MSVISKSVQRRLTIQRRDPRPVSEAAVLQAVKQFLEAKGFRVFRRNTRAVKFSYTSKRTGKTREQLVRYGEPGMADLWGWLVFRRAGYGPFYKGGSHIEVEIKAPGKTPNEAQCIWLDCAKDEGCFAFWADSVEMAEAKLCEWGL